jgi:hypothetical protein
MDAEEVQWEYIVFPIIGLITIVLVGVLITVILLFLKKRELFCFRKKRRKPYKRKKRDKNAHESQMDLYNRDNSAGTYGLKNRHRFQHYTDPFAKQFSDPLQMVQHNNFDLSEWDNPLFDTRAAMQRDAAITIQSWWRMARVRMRFLELKAAAIIFQKWWKGKQDRKKLPLLKKERNERNQRRKRQHDYIKNKGSLSALKFYDVKGYGFCEVQQLYGQETLHQAAEQLRSLYGGKGQKRFRLFISVKSVVLFDHATWRHFATVKMSTISFCSLDMKNKKLFAFINMKKKRKFCHVFQCHEGDSQRLVETMGEAFEFTFKQEKLRKEKERLAMKREQEFRKSAMELDKEVDEMMRLAESVSMATPSLHRKDTESFHSLNLTPKPNRTPSGSYQHVNQMVNVPYVVHPNYQWNYRSSSLDKGLDGMMTNEDDTALQAPAAGRQRARSFM